MHRIKILLATLFVVICSFSVGATIGIERVVSNSTFSKCEGSFTVVADGSAGPFTIRLVSSVNGVPDVVHNDIKGDLVVEDLCNGVYEVHVYPTRFPNCVTILEAELKSPKGPKMITQNKALQLDVSPNPTQGKVMVSVTIPPAEGKAVQGDCTITVLDANGLSLEESSVITSAKSSRVSVPLDLSRYPRGVYYVRVRTAAGAEETGRVVVQ